MSKRFISCLAIFALSMLISGVFYPILPYTLAIHWNDAGYPDGFMQKNYAILLMPILIISLTLIISVIINADPLKKNIDQFQKYVDLTIFSIMLFFIYIQLLTLLWNFKPRSFNLLYPLLVGVSLLFAIIAFVFPKTFRNYTFGIRTPWTLASDVVWKKTHVLGSKLFWLASLICFLGLFWVNHALVIFLFSLLIIVIILIIYSYFVFRNQNVVKRRKSY